MRGVAIPFAKSSTRPPEILLNRYPLSLSPQPCDTLKCMIYRFTANLQEALSKGTRSTVIKPLGWLIALCISGSMGVFYSHGPPWIGAMLGVFAAITILVYLFFYIYFAFKDPDALRSESYSIQKLALEKGILGDSTTGDIRLKDVTPAAPEDKDILISAGGEGV